MISILQISIDSMIRRHIALKILLILSFSLYLSKVPVVNIDGTLIGKSCEGASHDANRALTFSSLPLTAAMGAYLAPLEWPKTPVRDQSAVAKAGCSNSPPSRLPRKACKISSANLLPHGVS